MLAKTETSFQQYKLLLTTLQQITQPPVQCQVSNDNNYQSFPQSHLHFTVLTNNGPN